MTAVEQIEGEDELDVSKIVPDSYDSEIDARNPNLVKGDGVIRYGSSAAHASIPALLGGPLFNQVALDNEYEFAVPVGEQNITIPVRSDPHDSHSSEGEVSRFGGNSSSRVEISGKLGSFGIIKVGDGGEKEVTNYQVPVSNSTKTGEVVDELNLVDPVNVVILDKSQSKVQVLGTPVSCTQSATHKEKKSSGRKITYDNALPSQQCVLMESLESNKVGFSSKQNEHCKRDQKKLPLKQKFGKICKDVGGKENQEQDANTTFPIFEHFLVKDEEGSGGYGTVYSSERKSDGKKFAIKCPRGKASVQHAHREREVLKRFGGRNFIIRYEGSLKSGNDECFILQHVEHDRPEVLKKEIDISQLQWYSYCMFRALACLHAEGVVHRDVKPANFLFSRKMNKGYLIDFNLAMDLRQKFSAGTQDAMSKMATSAEKLREPMPISGRKELISLVQIQSAMRSPSHKAVNILGSQRKRVATPLSPLDKKKIHLSPMPLHSAGIAVPGAGLLRNKDDKSRKDGLCGGTKGFRAPEVLFKSQYQGPKIDIWSAGVTLLYLILGRTPFGGDPEQNIKDITKLRGSEDLWELAKLHNCESSFPPELLDIQYLPSMDIQSWCKKNTKRPEFFELIPSSLFDLVSKCLTINPRLRISADEALRHKFIAPCHEIMTKQRLLRKGLTSASPSELG